MKTQTNERPIPFTGPEVRAIIDGRKTQTRRIVKPQSAILTDEIARAMGVRPPEKKNQPVIACSYGSAGHRLWVRETFTEGEGTIYRADWSGDSMKGLWKSPLSMPRRLSRITLEITAVRVERLGKITESDAKAEGISYDMHWQGYVTDSDGRNYHGSDPRLSFRSLWTAINGEDAWDANPWVWVVEFRKI